MTTKFTKRIVIDCETTSNHKTIHCVVTKDIDSGEVKVWSNPSNLWAYIEDSLLIGHNLLGFDSVILNSIWKTKIRMSQCFDTLVLSRLLDPSKTDGHSLEAWGKILGNHKADYLNIWKWITQPIEYVKGMEWDNPHMPLLIDYCKQDVEVTEQLYHHLLKVKEEKEFSDESVDLEHKVAAIITKQIKNGFKLDVQYATGLLADIKREMDGVYEQLQQRWPSYERERFSEKTGKQLKSETITFNPGSRQQIGEKLKELGWKPEKFTETGQPQVDEVVLMHVDIPEAKMIARYLLLQKRVSQIEQWFDALGDDGRIHGRVITNGAVTGRMTHMSPNMAQIPNAGSVYGHECRQCWTVEQGNVLVGCDASGLELRMLAHYMKDEKYVHTVTNGSSKEGTDVHTVNQKAAGLPTRDAAKTFIYAFLYGAGDAKIGSIVGGTATEGRKLKAKFLKQTPALSKLIESVGKYAAKGYVPGLDGRRIWVRSEHAALNSLLQGAGAVVMKKALVLFMETVHKNRWDVKLVANVHDEIQFECSPEIADAAGKACKQAIIDAGVAFKLRCPLDGEYKIGNNWKETH